MCAIHAVFFLDLHPSVIFQLQLLTTWGDPYYIGLNGLEFYDQNHEKISLSDNSILSCEFTSTFVHFFHKSNLSSPARMYPYNVSLLQVKNLSLDH